jgi:hypothetical protein
MIPKTEPVRSREVAGEKRSSERPGVVFGFETEAVKVADQLRVLLLKNFRYGLHYRHWFRGEAFKPSLHPVYNNTHCHFN